MAKKKEQDNVMVISGEIASPYNPDSEKSKDKKNLFYTKKITKIEFNSPIAAEANSIIYQNIKNIKKESDILDKILTKKEIDESNTPDYLILLQKMMKKLDDCLNGPILDEFQVESLRAQSDATRSMVDCVVDLKTLNNVALEKNIKAFSSVISADSRMGQKTSEIGFIYEVDRVKEIEQKKELEDNKISQEMLESVVKGLVGCGEDK